MYLPATFVYNDLKELNWITQIDSTYEVTGDKLYQANKAENGNYVGKYLIGVSILQAPFFALGHFAACQLDTYPSDGFSLPYQYAIAFGALLYAFLALLGLRKILLYFFDDSVTALSLSLLFLCSNLVQYISVDAGISHVFILPLYVLILYFTVKWHQRPSILYAALAGITIGIATICRPTEFLMILIPILWQSQDKRNRALKWQLVRTNKLHIFVAAIFLLIGILPQLIYWQYTTGSFIYNVGSKWVFLNPWFRVLVGIKNGWFIYTPIAFLMFIGLFFVKKYPFGRAVMYFGLLNIWVIVSWFDWKYGATYSCRALTQSYPIYALALAAIIQKSFTLKMKWIWAPILLFLTSLNTIQIYQYNNAMLLPRYMTFSYYSGIFMQPKPTPLAMARLDTQEEMKNTSNISLVRTLEEFPATSLKSSSNTANYILDTTFTKPLEKWIRVQTDITLTKGFFTSYLNAEIYSKDSVKYSRIRLFNPACKEREANSYAFDILIPEKHYFNRLVLYVGSSDSLLGTLHNLKIEEYKDNTVKTCTSL